MKTVTVTFPIQEAVEALRLLRGESRCMIEQTEYMPDLDITKRINHVLSARERITTALEGIAETEDVIEDPSQIALNIATPKYRGNKQQDAATGQIAEMMSGGNPAPIATQHLPSFNQPDVWEEQEDWYAHRKESVKESFKDRFNNLVLPSVKQSQK